MIFLVVMYGCESWAINKAKHPRIDAFGFFFCLFCFVLFCFCFFELMLLNCRVGEDSWTLAVPWTARRSNQSILKECTPEYSLEGLMLKLKLQYFGHLMQRTDSLEKTLMLGKTEGRRRG